MGDYYKYKKILIILMIFSCGFNIIKNIFKTHVEASEAVEVTPVWNDGTYTYQSDNQYLTLQNNQIAIQDELIYQLSYNYDRYPDSVKSTCQTILTQMVSRRPSNDTRWIWFTHVPFNDTGTSAFAFQIINPVSLSNITYADATLNDGYKLLSVPFYNVSRNSTRSFNYISFSNGSISNTITTGSQLVPCAEMGAYSSNWFMLFEKVGLIGSQNDYNNILSSIEETNELNYTQSYYTRELVENTYNSINNSNVTTISSSGITQPEVTEPDLSDAFDSITNILTNDNATTKSFTFTLPNNDSFNFSLDPNFLRTSLTRVGGGAIVTIIETLWYIGLYGLFIFTYLKIIGALLAGDLDNITGVLSPVNSVVSSSLEVTGAFRTSGGDESAFRIRRG